MSWNPLRTYEPQTIFVNCARPSNYRHQNEVVWYIVEIILQSITKFRCNCQGHPLELAEPRSALKILSEYQQRLSHSSISPEISQMANVGYPFEIVRARNREVTQLVCLFVCFTRITFAGVGRVDAIQLCTRTTITYCSSRIESRALSGLSCGFLW